MKKKILALTMMTIAAFSFCACGSTENTVSNTTSETADSQETKADTTETADAYSFNVDGTELTPDMDLDSVLDSLGEPVSTFESESCAKQGMAYLYTYADYEIETYPDGDVNRIYYISLSNDNVATEEGVDLSFSKDQVIEVYGEPTESDDNSLVYKKSDDGSCLKFIFESDDNMISIEYDSKEM